MLRAYVVVIFIIHVHAFSAVNVNNVNSGTEPDEQSSRLFTRALPDV